MLYTFKKGNKTNDNFNFDYKLDLNKYKDKSNDSDYTLDILNKISSIFSWTKKDDDLPIEIKFESPTPSYKFIGISPEALNLEWNKAATRLYDYIYYSANPSYDFKIGGVPVKVHGNYIQVGTILIPKYTKSNL